MAYVYGGSLFLLIIASLLASPSRLYVYTIHWCLMNLVLLRNYEEYPLLANLMLLGFAVMHNRLDVTAASRVEVEDLYDELRGKHYELEQARWTMLDYAKQVQAMAQTEERNRIACELHDDLGHKLIRMKMMQEAAIELMPHRPEKSTVLFTGVKDGLIESMESLRATVRNMKPDYHSIRGYSLKTLIEEISKDTGIPIVYRYSGSPYPLYPSEELVLYRNAQEAITNAIRHGSADQVWVSLHYEPNQLSLDISNNGTKPDTTSVTKGLGLIGMEERVSVLGGEVQVDIRDLFTIRTRLPRMPESS